MLMLQRLESILDNTTSNTGTPSYIIATGGTITTSGDYKIHTFTADGTFCVSMLVIQQVQLQ
jgi:hypothetical protein